MNAFTALRLITPRQWSRRADAVDRIGLPDGTEGTGYFYLDTDLDGYTFGASLIGIVTDEGEPLSNDEAVERWDGDQVEAWETASVALANGE